MQSKAFSRKTYVRAYLDSYEDMRKNRFFVCIFSILFFDFLTFPRIYKSIYSKYKIFISHFLSSNALFNLSIEVLRNTYIEAFFNANGDSPSAKIVSAILRFCPLKRALSPVNNSFFIFFIFSLLLLILLM